MMKRTYQVVVFLFSIAFAAEAIIILGNSAEEASRLSLNIYLDGTGNALVTGYAENPERLAFLNSSQHSYENETSQLYALTNALTRKEGDTWAITFQSPGYYEEYRVTFYLPSDFKVKNVSRSQGLDYLLSTSNDSLALDFQGYNVYDPVASIEYLQPLEARPPPIFRPTDLLLLILILTVGATAALGWRYMARRPHGSSTNSIEKTASFSEMKDVMTGTETQHLSTPITGVESSSEMASETGTLAKNNAPFEQPSVQTSYYEEYLSFEPEAPGKREIDEDEETMTEAEFGILKPLQRKIEISSEMAAVMETLTPRERAILQALIDRGGRSTQRDLRYETRTPKSSLSGIINSLERRNLVIRKEWGRTNVIELSDWFLSKKE